MDIVGGNHDQGSIAVWGRQALERASYGDHTLKRRAEYLTDGQELASVRVLYTTKHRPAEGRIAPASFQVHPLKTRYRCWLAAAFASTPRLASGTKDCYVLHNIPVRFPPILGIPRRVVNTVSRKLDLALAKFLGHDQIRLIRATYGRRVT
jgi:hypothetical protein